MKIQKFLKFLLIPIIFMTGNLWAQENSTTEYKLGLYLDLFYGYDFNTPESGGQRLPYIYQYSRHNEFNLNHGAISIGMKNPRYRANLGFHAGTYVDDNYALESGTAKNIFDANIGLALDKRSRWWVDAGIFGNSWIGMQSTFAFDNVVVAHNLNSEYTPYYYAGLFTSFQPDRNWRFSVGITNGWQRIQRVEGNSLLSFGWQILYANEKGLTFNLSSFSGTDDPDSTRRIRHLNNLYTFIPLGSKWMIKAGFDIGIQQEAKGSNQYHNWYGLTFVLNYNLAQRWAISGRYEYYFDPDEVIVDGITPIEDFRTAGISFNVDYLLIDFMKARFEVRYLASSEDIYPKDGDRVNDDLFFVITLTSKWEKILNR